MNAKLQVFVSSTYKDLLNERQAAVEAILKAGHIPAGMELFSAGNQSQLEVIQRWISESDIFMLILGGRYGSIHHESEKSYTELEYDYAESIGKPIFAVVVTDEALESRVRLHGSSVIEREHTAELKDFRERVTSRMCSFFSDAKDIKLAIHETIPDFQRRYNLPGWVRADALEQLSQLREDLAGANKRTIELQEQLNEALKRVDKAKAKQGNQWSDDELLEISKLLGRENLDTILRGTKMKHSILSLVLTYRNSMMIGVNNHAGMSSEEQLLFFRVFPKLETHAMASLEKNPGVQWRTYRLNAKGAALLAYLDRVENKFKEQACVAEIEEKKGSSAAQNSTGKSTRPKKKS